MQVQACLATVMDPELDESVIDLDFITEVELLEDGEVRIGFRLPTYWCAANFAFLMADDMRRAVKTLPWVTQVKVQLHDHMYAEAINQGVKDGAGFEAAFGVAAEGGLEALRRTFALKAFQRRQEALLQHLFGKKYAPETLVSLDLAALQRVPLEADGETLVERYLERRPLVGGAPLAFVDTEGRPIAAEALSLHVRDLRRVGVNAEFNGTLCRGLLAVRDRDFGEKPIHFVPYRPAASTH
ncbi:iron-sulfur cluster assembly protein [Polaromonas sp.]|nr:iron-sulfur cluster assembly protein [Polaromonas sp.]